MKFTTIYLGKNKIEFFNSILGKETVKVNDKQVSSRFSFTGTDHIFKIKEDENEVECKLSTGFCFGRFLIDLSKNGEPVIISDRTSFCRIIQIVMVIVIAVWLIDGFNIKQVVKGWNETSKQIPVPPAYRR